MKTFKVSIKLGLFLLLFLLRFNNYASFLEDQLQYSRVRKAYHQKKPIIIEKLANMDLTLKNVNVLIKAYKLERIVKVYVKSKQGTQWQLYDAFDFCAFSGVLGPKRAEGDYQIPEGFYQINHFNPYSNFHLSLGVSYPNKSDRIKSSAAKKGGAIYMHGNCVTIGCIPIQDEPIKEVYLLAVLGKNNGQEDVAIDILPFEYSTVKLRQYTQRFAQHKAFWENLYVIESVFDSTHVQPLIGINNKGDYYLRN